MRTINHYVVEISDDKGVLDAKNEFRVDQHKVIAENDEYLAVDDRRFTTLKKGTSDYETASTPLPSAWQPTTAVGAIGFGIRSTQSAQ